MLTGYLSPSAGQAWIAGFDISKNITQARQKMGYLPENAPLYTDMSVLDFLRFVLQLRRVPTRLHRQRLQEVCERCGLLQVLGQLIGRLSKGFRQRVGLAQALVHDPDLLILDEPTSGLDPNQIGEMRQLMADLAQDKTILLSTHILSEVQATCSRVLIIHEGQLVADKNTASLHLLAECKRLQVVLAPRYGYADITQIAQLQHAIQESFGVVTVEMLPGEGGSSVGLLISYQMHADPRADVFNWAVNHDWTILNMHNEHVSLEQAFKQATQMPAAGVAHA